MIKYTVIIGNMEFPLKTIDHKSAYYVIHYDNYCCFFTMT